MRASRGRRQVKKEKTRWQVNKKEQRKKSGRETAKYERNAETNTQSSDLRILWSVSPRAGPTASSQRQRQMDRYASTVAEHPSPSQSPTSPAREMPPPSSLIWPLTAAMALLLTLSPTTTATGLPFGSATSGFTAISWPIMSLAGFDHYHDYSEFADPGDHHLSPSAAYASVLPLGVPFDYDPYGFSITQTDPMFHHNPYITLSAQRTDPGLVSDYKKGRVKNREPTPKEHYNRPSKIFRITKPVKQYSKDGLHYPSLIKHLNPDRGIDSRFQVANKTPYRRMKDDSSGIKGSAETFEQYASGKDRLRIPESINLLPFPQREFAPERAPKPLEPGPKPRAPPPTDATYKDSPPRRRFGQRKQRLRRLQSRRLQGPPRAQHAQDIGANASESQAVLKRQQRESGEHDEDFMPSQYVIDLKFRKSSKDLTPNSMRSKGFTETHHRLLERFEEIHHHGDTKHDAGHTGKSERYSNQGYHGSSDDSHELTKSGSVGRDSKAITNAGNRVQDGNLYSDASSPKVVETAAPSPSEDRGSAEITVPPVTLGKPPITVRTLLDGTGSSRGPPLTIAYRGPHSAHVHPPIPSKSFRVNDGFRRWATSKVRW